MTKPYSKTKEYQKEWRKNHPLTPEQKEIVNERNKVWRKNNPPTDVQRRKRNAQLKEWRKNNPLTPEQVERKNALQRIANKKRHDKVKGLSVKSTPKEFAKCLTVGCERMYYNNGYCYACYNNVEKTPLRISMQCDEYDDFCPVEDVSCYHG